MQTEQAGLPLWETLPTGHLMHWVAPALEYEPEAQAEQ